MRGEDPKMVTNHSAMCFVPTPLNFFAPAFV